MGAAVVREVALKLFVVFAEAIYAHGVQASLPELPEVEEMYCVVGVARARAHRELHAAATVLLEYDLTGAADLAEELGELSDARVRLCTRGSWSEELASADRTASGVLAAGTLTPEVVTVAVRAISTGVGVLWIDLLRELCRERPIPASRRRRAPHTARARRASGRGQGDPQPRDRAASRLPRADRQERPARRADQARCQEPGAMAVREGII